MAGSCGIVRRQSVDFTDRVLKLETGEVLSPVSVAYETYGKLSEKKDNAVLVCHALSGDAHAAGYHGVGPDEKPGWWDVIIGPGKPLDTDRYFVVCSNFLGSCYGTTGPASINRETGRPYGLDFPVFTIRDMVEVQRWLIDHLEIDKMVAVIGGSMGGMQALQWAVSYPGRMRGVIPIATTSRMSAQGIALNEVGRQAILADPSWQSGRYDPGCQPDAGLALARMIAHITYLSEQSMHRKFGRQTIQGEGCYPRIPAMFQVESYLHHQGRKFVQRFDANTYLYITRAMDSFDLEGAYGSLESAVGGCRSSFLVLSFSSDWLFPTSQSVDIVNALKRTGRDVSFCEIESDQGHDAFLLPGHRMGDVLSGFLTRLSKGGTL